MAGLLRHWLLEKRFFARPAPTQFVEPTPQGRRALLLRRGLLVAALSALFVASYLLLAYVKALPDCEWIPWVRGLLAVVVGLPLGMAVYAMRLATRMRRAGQWPLPGTPVLWRRPIERGRRLRWRARGLFAVGTANAVAAFACAGLLAFSPLFQSSPPDSRCGRIQAAHSTENVR